jgi:hypothetical protein
MSNTKDEYTDKEATKRMEDALRRALTTPHKPNQAFVGKAKKAKKPNRRRAKP